MAESATISHWYLCLFNFIFQIL